MKRIKHMLRHTQNEREEKNVYQIKSNKNVICMEPKTPFIQSQNHFDSLQLKPQKIRVSSFDVLICVSRSNQPFHMSRKSEEF